MIIVIVSVVIICICFYYLLKPDKKYNGLRKFTSKECYFPLIGHSYLFLSRNMHEAITRVTSKIVPCVLWEGPQPIYLTNDPEEIKILLNSPYSLSKLKKYKFLDEVFGNSIIKTEADTWHKNRKILSKAFQQNILDSFVYTFYEKSNILIDVLKKTTPKDDLFGIFEKYTMDSFLVTNTGVDRQVQLNEYVELVDYLARGQKISTERFFKPYLWNDFIFNVFGEGVNLRKEVDKTSQYLEEVMEKRKDMRKFSEDYNANYSKPIMDLMLDLNEQDKLDEAYIINEMRVFFYAATDTTAYTLTFTSTLLGMNPKMQEKLYDEVINVVGPDKPIESTDLPKLKYTEMVLNESLRLCPVVPYIGRSVTAPIHLGKVVLPEGTQVGVLIFQVHRSEKYYPDPLKFDPDRFLPEEIAKRPSYTFLPYSGGPRNCIGWKYAMMILKTALANIVRNFKLHSNYKSVTDLKLVSFIVMRTTDNIHCTFSPRHEVG